MNLTCGKSSLVQIERIVCFLMVKELIIVSLLHQTSFGLDCKSKINPPSILKVSSGCAPETTGIGAVIPHWDLFYPWTSPWRIAQCLSHFDDLGVVTRHIWQPNMMWPKTLKMTKEIPY